MKRFIILMIFFIISLICPEACSIEISGGVIASAENADISGVAGPGTFAVNTGGYMPTEHVNPGEMMIVYESEVNNNGIGHASASLAAMPLSHDTSTGGYAFKGYKWAADNPKVSFQIDASNRGTGITGSDLVTAISFAASTWDAQSPQELFGNLQPAAVPLGGSINGKNEIGWKKLGTTGTIARTTATVYSNTVTEADVMFNKRLTWTTSAALSTNPQKNPRNIYYNALHELGHVLGMADLSYDTKEVMAPAGLINHAFANKYALGSGDITGIKLLYPDTSGGGGAAGSLI